MDIHKPKAWHGFREFLKEYVIIVVGVLTALAAEQGVEWLHWRHQIAETEAALQSEVQDNLLSSYERIVGRVCIGRRIATLRDQLLLPGPAWKAAQVAPAREGGVFDLATLASASQAARGPGAMPLVYATPTRPWGTGVWTAAVSSGTVNHMDRERALAYAALFRMFEQLRETQDEEQAARSQLAALAFDRELSEAEKTQFLNVLGRLNMANERSSIFAAQLIQRADLAGLRVKASAAKARLETIAKTRADCYQPVTIPLAPG